jgi:nucleoside-diphosphate-sugar epimerase
MPPLPADDLEFILSRTEALWHEMRGNRLFVTGGTGFFGCWLVESFLEANRRLGLGAQLHLLTRSPKAFLEKCPHLANETSLHFCTGDVRNFTFPDGEFPFFIHAATEASARLIVEDPLYMLSTAIEGSRRSLEFAASHATRKFLLTSSGAVYGEQPANLTHIVEAYRGAPNQLDPASVYSEGKRAAELMCAVYGKTHGFECKIARCFAFVGPHLPLDAHFAIGNFIRDAMRGESIQVQGDGTPKRSYMYAADLAIWLWTLLFRAPPLDPYNVGSDQSISISDLAHAVTAALGSTARVRVAQCPTPGAELRQYVPRVEKALRELGLRCEITLDDAIRRTAAWHGYPVNLNPL